MFSPARGMEPATVWIPGGHASDRATGPGHDASWSSAVLKKKKKHLQFLARKWSYKGMWPCNIRFVKRYGAKWCGAIYLAHFCRFRAILVTKNKVIYLFFFFFKIQNVLRISAKPPVLLL